jgi:hypothetical protein
MTGDSDKDAILRELLAEAEKRFGRGRIEALRATLEATATELAQVRAAAAGPEVEPMFYPHSAE